MKDLLPAKRNQKYCDSYKHKLIILKNLFRKPRIQEGIFGKDPWNRERPDRQWCYNQISVLQGGLGDSYQVMTKV